MSKEICLSACDTSFSNTVNKLNEVLFDALIQANGDASLEQRAKDNFGRGLKLANTVRDTCIAACNS